MSPSLPDVADRPSTATVTFLFTDIVGSTRLWDRHPEAMREALDRHDALLARIVSASRGVIFRTMGDAICAAFDSATDAVAAAIDAQRRLEAEPWPEPARLTVRMGIHTGIAELRDGDYLGPPLNRVARLLSTAHGGQIVLSETTTELVRGVLERGVALVELGEYRLRGLDRPERIFQITAPGLRTAFPPLEATRARPYNLPTTRTSLIGREQEIADARAMLLRPDVGLLTLTGPGGTGKTRLAQEVARRLVDEFEHGVCFVALASVGEASLVVPLMAATLGVQDVAGTSQVENIKDYLRDRRLLLVLDNFEHVLGAAPVVAELLGACPRLTILATSRALLRLRDEHQLPVPPLGFPLPGQPWSPDSLVNSAAVTLFEQRAKASNPDFRVTGENVRHVAAICAQLDGLPLAIELAAARVKLVPPRAMLTRLEQAHGRSRLDLLGTGPQDLPVRHQKLYATIAWSYDLLDAPERALFRRLAAFVEGCTLQAADVVANLEDEPQIDVLDVMASLVGKSLIVAEEAVGGENRFAMLHVVREYALDQLEQAGEDETVRRQHAEYYVALADEGEQGLRSGTQLDWLARLEAEQANFRSALAWSLTNTNAIEYGLRLASSLQFFWFMRGNLAEGSRWLSGMLERSGAAAPWLRARALAAAGTLARFQCELERAAGLLEASLALYRSIGDKRGIARALSQLGLAVQQQGHGQQGIALLEESVALYRELGDAPGLAVALLNLGAASSLACDFDRAQRALEECQATHRQLGNLGAVSRALGHLGEAVYAQSDFDRAASYCQEALSLGRRVADVWGTILALNILGNVACIRGDHAQATAYLQESLALRRESGQRTDIAECFQGIACLAVAEDRFERAARLFGAAEAVLERLCAIPSPIRPVTYGRDVARTRAGLGDGAFSEAWTQGRAMTLEQAIAYALEAEPSE